MSEEGMESTEASTESAPEVTETTEAPKESETPEASEAPNKVNAAPTPPPFTPNTKFKVHDVEHEIDKLFHGLMTDAEKEKLVRQLHEKAYGLDVVKPKYQKLRDQYQQVEPLLQSWNKLNDYYNKKDYANFFKGLNVSNDVIMDYASEILKYEELTPEQRQAYDSNVNARNQLAVLEQEVAQLRSAQQQAATQSRGMELESELKRPDVAAVAAKYDGVYGAGAFRELVIGTGEAAWNSTKIDHSAKTVVDHLMAQYAPFIGEQAPAQGATIETVQGRPVVQRQKPTMPNIQGATTSPTKKIPTSIADLKKISRELAEQNQEYEGGYLATR